MAVRILALSLSFLASAALACDHSHSQYLKFRAKHACPGTGKTKGACPGYVVDHIVPLCAGGVDNPTNMQWQTVADSKLKDKLERLQCKDYKGAK